MTDITMCKGQDCLLRESCYRYTAPANPYRQSYFLTEPLDEIGDCKEWVDNNKLTGAVGVRVERRLDVTLKRRKKCSKHDLAR